MVPQTTVDSYCPTRHSVDLKEAGVARSQVLNFLTGLLMVREVDHNAKGVQ